MMTVSRIQDLHDVQVCLDDGLPLRLCPLCKCRLERGTEDLWDVFSQVRTSYE